MFVIKSLTIKKKSYIIELENKKKGVFKMPKEKKELVLQVERKVFRDNNSLQNVEYLDYYVELPIGENKLIRLSVKPSNATAKELLSSYFEI